MAEGVQGESMDARIEAGVRYAIVDVRERERVKEGREIKD